MFQTRAFALAPCSPSITAGEFVKFKSKEFNCDFSKGRVNLSLWILGGLFSVRSPEELHEAAGDSQ